MQKFGKLFMLVMALALVLTGCSKNEDGDNKTSGSNSTSGQKKPASNADLSDDVKVEAEDTGNGSLVVFVTNNNKVSVDMDIEVEFYDADEKLVGTGDSYLMAVEEGHELAVEIYDVPEDFETYEVYVDAEESESESFFDDIEITSNDNGEEIVVQAKNNSESTIEEISITVVFYKDDKVVGVDWDMEFDVKAGRSANYEIYYPTDSDYDDIKFDEYKVYLIQAYNF